MKRRFILILAMIMLASLTAYGEQKIVIPESDTVVGIEDVEVVWQDPSNSDYYLIKLRDTTNNSIVIDTEQKYGSLYTIDHSHLTDDHVYQLSIGYVVGNNVKWLSTTFKVKDDPNHVIEPTLFSGKESFETELEDIRFSWVPDYSSDYYTVNLTNLNTDEVVIDNLKLSDNKYTISEEKLTKTTEYEIRITTVKGNVQKSDSITMFVNNQDLEQPRLIYPEDKSTLYRSNLRFLWSEIDTAQHYLVTIQDLTTGLTLIKNEKVIDHEYKILEDYLKEGHEYKISFAAVIKGVEKWNEANFKIKEPDLNYPNIRSIDNNEVVAYDALKVSWEGTTFIDGYDVLLKDLTSEKTIYYERLDDSHTTFSKDLLSPGHAYELTIVTVREDISRTKKLNFSVQEANFSNFEFNHIKDTHHKDMASFDWTAVDGIEKYSISIQDLLDKSILVDGVETEYSSYTVPMGILLEGRKYRIVITAKSDLDEKTISHDFKTNGYDAISTWAEEYVDSVAANEVLKPTFFTSLYNTPKDHLTRAEFCEMLVSLYDTMESPMTVLNLTLAKSFEDIGDLSSETQSVVLKANALGIISGTSDTTFTPTGKVTRQEMAVMLLNTYKAMHGEMTSEWKDKFADEDDIASWAVEGVKFSNAMEILSGDGERFNPNDLATHEMGFVLLDKAMKNFDK